MGNRVLKQLFSDKNEMGIYTATWYSRDTSGNILATYTSIETDETTSSRTIGELNIFGSDRLGIFKLNKKILSLPELGNSEKYREKGIRLYELKNLPITIGIGNVISVISDRLLSTDTDNDHKVNKFEAEILKYSDYYPFGFEMPDRANQFVNYRYGFNGMEKDNEFTNSTSHYDFGARIYDSRLGRWLAVDPLCKKYTDISTYSFVGNNPNCFIDPSGEIIRIFYDSGKVDSDGNPILNHFDYGSEMKVPDNKFVKDAVKALDHLITNKDAKKYVDYVSNSDYIVELKKAEESSAVPSNYQYAWDLGMDWNNEDGFILNGINKTSKNDRIPPAGILLHELIHKQKLLIAFLYKENLDKELANGNITPDEYDKQIDKYYSLWNEAADEDAIVDIETPIQDALGWGHREPEAYISKDGKHIIERSAYESGVKKKYNAESSISLKGDITEEYKPWGFDVGYKLIESECESLTNKETESNGE